MGSHHGVREEGPREPIKESPLDCLGIVDVASPSQSGHSEHSPMLIRIRVLGKPYFYLSLIFSKVSFRYAPDIG